MLRAARSSSGVQKCERARTTDGRPPETASAMDGGTASGSGLARAQLVLPSYSVEDCVALVLHFLNSHGLSSTATVLHKEAIARQLVPSLLTPGASHLHPTSAGRGFDRRPRTRRRGVHHAARRE